MRNFAVTAFLFLQCGLIFLSCNNREVQNESTSQVDTVAYSGQTFVYDCAALSDIVIKVDTADAWLFLSDTTVHLTQAISASGARFTAGSYLYWSTGGEATFEFNDQSYQNCTMDREQATWEDARLRGVDLRAAGNEPGWYIEIESSSQIKYILNYGEDTLYTPTPDPVSYPDRQETIYNIETADHTISIRIMDESCSSMSGKQFSSTTFLTIDGKEYRGCGMEL